MEALAETDGDLDFADEVVLPFIVNLTDDNILKFAKRLPLKLLGDSAASHGAIGSSASWRRSFIISFHNFN